MPRLLIPDPLLKFTQGKGELQFPSSSVQVFIANLKESYPALHQVLFGPQNNLNGFVNIYLNHNLFTDRFTENNASLLENDFMEIVVAVSGG
jgi:hypothetical protein